MVGVPIEQRSFLTDWEIRADETDGMTFEGYASVFGGPPNAFDEIFKPGCFRKTIDAKFKQRVKSGAASRIKVLYLHREPLGIPLEMREDATGLFTKSRVSDTATGRDAMTLIRDGVVDGLSIGFRALRFKFEDQDGKQIRIVEEAELVEYSPVVFAAESRASVTATRALELFSDDSVLRALAALKNGTLPAVVGALEAREDEESETRMIDKSDAKKIKGMVAKLRDLAAMMEDMTNETRAEPEATAPADTGDDSQALQVFAQEIRNLTQELSTH